MVEGEVPQLTSEHAKVDEDGSGTLAENLSTRNNLPVSINELKSRIRQQILMLGNPGDEKSINRVFNAYLAAFCPKDGQSEEIVLSNVSYFLQSKISNRQQNP